MNWMLVGGLWGLLAVAVVLLIGRGIWIADQRERARLPEQEVDAPRVPPRRRVAPPKAGSRRPRR